MLMFWRLVSKLFQVRLAPIRWKNTAQLLISILDDQTGLSMFESDVRTGICNEILSQFVPRFEFATHQHQVDQKSGSKKPETKFPEVGFQNDNLWSNQLSNK